MMSENLLQRIRRSIGHYKRSLFPDPVSKLYSENEYLTAYAKHTDMRVDKDPHQAIGGLWEEMGTLQFDFLVQHGLRPGHTLLDIGCGTLRGGQHFIQYLNPCNYTGIDISPKAIEYGLTLVRQGGLQEKKPVLMVNKDLTFGSFQNQTFDYILAQSVFSHLLPEHIQECFNNIGRIMGTRSAFFFTYNDAGAFEQTGVKDFRYPFSFFENIATKCNVSLEDMSSAYPHPHDQRMVRAVKQ